MDELERKYVQEVKDLLSSVDLKLLELLKTESKETFMTEEIIKKNEKDPTTYQESFICPIGVVTEKAVQILNGNKFAWIPKKCIKNLDKIVVKEGSQPEIIVHEWFASKVEWKVSE